LILFKEFLFFGKYFISFVKKEKFQSSDFFSEPAGPALIRLRKVKQLCPRARKNCVQKRRTDVLSIGIRRRDSIGSAEVSLWPVLFADP
jgi:hypothetical protein